MIKMKYGDNLAKEFAKHWNRQVRSLRMGGIALGAILAILGVICFVAPEKSVVALETIVSVVILALGVFRAAKYFSTPVFFRFGGSLIGAIFNIMIGIFLLTRPQESMLTIFSFVIALELLIVGINQLSYTAKLRFFNANGYSWIIFSGVTNILAAILFFAMPANSAILISAFIGIYLLIDGLTLIIESVCARDYEIKLKDERKRLREIKEAELVDKEK